MAQLKLWRERASAKPGVEVLPKELDEEVARLHLSKIGVKLTVLAPAQEEYLGIDAKGPYKPSSYRY
jgi:adenosylhomocysteinase